MPVADWNERSRTSFQASPPKISGITKLTRIRIQLMAFELSGVTTGAPSGFTCVPCCFVTVEVGAAVACAAGVLTAVEGLLTYAVLGPIAREKMTCANTATSTIVVANSKGFSERAGVTRYQCPSHIAVITPPRAKAAAKKLAMVKTPPRLADARGRKIIASTNRVTRPATTVATPLMSRKRRTTEPRGAASP